MLWNEIVSAVCICISCGIYGGSLLRNSKLNILFLQIFSVILYIMSYAFMVPVLPTATAGLIAASCEFLRVLVFFTIEKTKKYNTVKVNMTLAIIFCIVLVILTALMWQGWVSIFPLLATIITSIALGSKNVLFIKISIIFASVLTWIYLFILQLWINAISQVCVTCLGIIGIILFFLSKKATQSQNINQ